ncbi:MAG: hypothetical protein AB6733_16085 [Clostridiaceae bacterium]
MMRSGNHMMGYGFYGGYILMAIFFVLLVSIIYILVKNKKTTNPEVVKLITYLKYNFANGKISKEEYYEKKSILDNSDLVNPVIFALVEMYIKSNLTLKELYILNEKLENEKITKDEVIDYVSKD